ncbi:MAG: glucosyltransferase domain-containing protein [Clostridia bacterium]|nr:glucosyltransferase domain-containing protein [Clostridia bacterium]
MPEKTLKKLNSYILPQWKICFLGAILVGLIAHLYKITNWLPNWDSLVFRYDSQNMLGLGRWFLPVVCSFTSFYDLPFLNGLVAILFHAAAAVGICKILNVQKKLPAFLIGAVIVSFPTVTSVMMYNYVADGYGVAFFLSVLAAVFMTKDKPSYIVGAIFIMLSTAIYQAYITVTIMLVLFKLIDEIIYGDIPFKITFKKILAMIATGILGMVMYYAILKILLSVFSVGLKDYQGIGSAMSFSGINLRDSLYYIKHTFLGCFFDFSKGVNVFVVLNIIIFAFTSFHYIKYIFVNKIYKNPAKILLLPIMAVMLVIGAGVLAFINPGIDYHNLMLMGYSIFYIFFLALYERGADSDRKHTCIKCWTIFIVSTVLIANQIVISNVSYHKAQLAYEKSYGVLVRIDERIEEIPEADKCNRIMVVGALDNSSDYSVNLTPDITGITDGYIIRADDETVGQSVLCSALNDYCDKDYTFVAGKEKENLLKRKEVKALGKWPSKDCVAVIDDVIVIKLGVESESE